MTEAKADESSAIDLDEARKRNLLRLQALLVSRFGLKMHWESKIRARYVLEVAKHGQRLKPSAPGGVHTSQQGRGKLLCSSCSISSLASFISNFTGKPIQDETSIQGTYDINLAFEPFNSEPAQDSGKPSLFTALQEQLGLQLDGRKLAVQILVVDHMERPGNN